MEDYIILRSKTSLNTIIENILHKLTRSMLSMDAVGMIHRLKNSGAEFAEVITLLNFGLLAITDLIPTVI